MLYHAHHAGRIGANKTSIRTGFRLHLTCIILAAAIEPPPLPQSTASLHSAVVFRGSVADKVALLCRGAVGSVEEPVFKSQSNEKKYSVLLRFQDLYSRHHSNTLSTTMPIRPIRSNDLLPVSHILARAFEKESSIGCFVHPYQSDYPDDMYLYFLRYLRVDLARGTDHLLVSYDGKNENQITGFAHWTRKRKDPKPLPLSTKAHLKTIEAYNAVEAYIYPNRAAEPSRTNLKAIVMPFLQHHWTGERAENWYLAVLGVDPSHQKLGYGRELVRFGFEKAEEEHVGCSVVSAAGRENFYQACGFDVIAGRVRDEGGEANPLRDVGGGTIMFADAKDGPAV